MPLHCHTTALIRCMLKNFDNVFITHQDAERFMINASNLKELFKNVARSDSPYQLLSVFFLSKRIMEYLIPNQDDVELAINEPFATILCNTFAEAVTPATFFIDGWTFKAIKLVELAECLDMLNISTTCCNSDISSWLSYNIKDGKQSIANLMLINKLTNELNGIINVWSSTNPQFSTFYSYFNEFMRIWINYYIEDFNSKRLADSLRYKRQISGIQHRIDMFPESQIKDQPATDVVSNSDQMRQFNDNLSDSDNDSIDPFADINSKYNDELYGSETTRSTSFHDYNIHYPRDDSIGREHIESDDTSSES